MSNHQRQLHEEIKKFIVNVSWTHKIQIVYSDLLTLYAKLVRSVILIFSAIVSSGLVYILLKDEQWAKVTTAIFSICVTILTALKKEFDFEGASIKVKNDANIFWLLREEALHLLYTITYNTKDFKDVSEEFDKLIDIRNRKSLELVNPPQKAINKASKFLKSRRDNDYVEDYKFLIPDELMEIKVEE